MITLLRYFLRYRWYLLLLAFFVYLQVAANLALPDYMARIVNEGVVGKQTDVVWSAGGMMLLIAFGGAAAMVVVSFAASKIATGVARDVRLDVFSRVEQFSLTEFNTFSTASLITRSTNDVQQIQTVFGMLLRIALMAPLTGVWAIIKATHTAPSMTWIMVLAVVVLISVIAVLFISAIPRFKKLQKLVDRLNLVTREMLTGMRVIRAFHTETAEEKKFDRTNEDLTRINVFVNRLMVIMHPIMMLIMNGTALAVLWYGAKQIEIGSIQIGEVMAFMQYSMQVIFAFLMISFVFIMVPRASVSATRISEVLATQPSIRDPLHPRALTPQQGAQVEFVDVSFTYAGAEEPVLEHVSFVAEPGKTTALIGSTGSGKSTIVNLIPRFYDVTHGVITINGVDIREMKLEDVYGYIGYVPQKPVVFSGTIASNILYGAPQATADDMRHAADIAQASEFIDKLEGGYEAVIAQGGTNISGGQKQRLSIARAIARKPQIYIFDDSFSALDFKTDAALRQALSQEIQQHTVIIVAQRINTIVHADRIIVLNEGKIVGQGTHTELMKSCSVYQEIALSQLSEQELNAVHV